ncbi:MAG: TFIIB-type zinc ribbon-containing protein [Firmicutes bacterium]|nr:TFIIB-type zinc ribbon-containing protein [Bacillota bacterium]
MRCPNCGSRFNKGLLACKYCGTTIKQIEEASHSAVVQAKEDYEPEKIVYSSIWPNDISRNNAFWLCMLCGIFGAHNFYTKRYLKATIGLVIWMLGISLFWLLMALMLAGEMYYEFIDTVLYGGGVPAVFLVVAFLMWMWDFFKIVTKTYKVPVVLKD